MEYSNEWEECWSLKRVLLLLMPFLFLSPCLMLAFDEYACVEAVRKRKSFVDYICEDKRHEREREKRKRLTCCCGEEKIPHRRRRMQTSFVEWWCVRIENKEVLGREDVRRTYWVTAGATIMLFLSAIAVVSLFSSSSSSFSLRSSFLLCTTFVYLFFIRRVRNRAYRAYVVRSIRF